MQTPSQARRAKRMKGSGTPPATKPRGEFPGIRNHRKKSRLNHSHRLFAIVATKTARTKTRRAQSCGCRKVARPARRRALTSQRDSSAGGKAEYRVACLQTSKERETPRETPGEACLPMRSEDELITGPARRKIERRRTRVLDSNGGDDLITPKRTTKTDRAVADMEAGKEVPIRQPRTGVTIWPADAALPAARTIAKRRTARVCATSRS